MSPSHQVLLIVICMLAEGFFSGIETGIISINRLRLLHLVRNGSVNGRIIEDLLRAPERLLGTTLVGTNLSTVIASTLATSLAEQHFNAWGRAAVTVAMSVLLLVFSEYLPKAWFNSRPIARCVPLARVLHGAEALFRPVAWLIMLLTEWAAPQRSRESRSPFVTREHIQDMTADSEASGQISALERLLINRVLDLQLKTAAEIMTPVEKIATTRPDTPLHEVIEGVRRHGHLKIPVLADDERRTCLGILYVQDVLARVADIATETAAQHALPAFFIEPQVRADDVLPLLRRNRQHMAIVRAQGRVVGLVTIENVLRILVGDLPSSTNGQRRPSPTAPA